MGATRLDAKKHANRFWIVTKSTRFWSGWWLAMKTGSFTTTWSANGRGRKAVRLPRRWPSLDWRPGRFFWVFGAIGRESSTMSCSPMAKRSIRTCTANNWTAWMQHSSRRGHLWSTDAELSSIRTTQAHTHLWWCARSAGSSDGRFFCIHHIVRMSHQVITYYFCPWRTSLVAWKLATRESCENWLSEFFDNREASFYKLASRWELVIEQNDAYLT